MTHLRGVVSVAIGSPDPGGTAPIVWAVSDVAPSLASLERTSVVDSLGTLVSTLRFRASSASPDMTPALSGARSIREVAGPSEGVGALLEVEGGQVTSALLCGIPPLDAPSLFEWHRTAYKSACQTVAFNVTLDGGDAALLLAPPLLTSHGTLLFEAAAGASGFASFTAVGTDSAGAAADPQRFGVRVVTLNSVNPEL